MWCLTLINEQEFGFTPASDAPLLPLSDRGAKALEVVWDKYLVASPESVKVLLDSTIPNNVDGVLFLADLQGLVMEAEKRDLSLGWTNLLKPDPYTW